MSFKDYFIERIVSFLCLVVVCLLIFLLHWILETPFIFICFSEIIIISFFTLIFILDYWRRNKYYKTLIKILDSLNEKTLLSEIINEPNFIEGQILFDVLKISNKYQNDKIAEAQTQNQEYQEYIDAWVHEIKTPITSARLIIENNKNVTTLKIDDELQKIERYVEQVLYYSRSTAIEKDFKVENTTLKFLVSSALKNYSKSLVQAKGKIQMCDLDIPLCADAKSVVFVIGQIISNAIKYRNNDFQLSFSSQIKNNAVCLMISDNGIGISQADIPRIFDKGFTGESGRTFTKSTGIGLYLCKKLCDKMNIEITLSSIMGSETTVTLCFPTESFLIKAGY